MNTPPPLPRSLAEKSKTTRLGDDVPALLCHPDFETPTPFCLWMHGRTVYKELDPGRYSRWLREGVATVSLDLPGHGERLDEAAHDPINSLGTIEQMVREIDGVLEALRDEPMFDQSRMAIGGMSLGGMCTLRRLCNSHDFKAAAVEATTGNLKDLYFPPDGSDPRGMGRHQPADVVPLDPSENLADFRPIPMLVLHSEADEMVPWSTQSIFLDRLRAHYEQHNADPSLIEVQTWPETGAPAEHVGFGRLSNEAKNTQASFLAEQLGATGSE